LPGQLDRRHFRGQLAEADKDALECSHLDVVADAGYSNGELLAACETQGITTPVPSNHSLSQRDGNPESPGRIGVVPHAGTSFCNT